MAGVTAHGASFLFSANDGSSFSATAVGVSFEAPTAEVVDMTGIDDPANFLMRVPTGAWSGGTLTVDYLHSGGVHGTQAFVRKPGVATFSSAGFSVSRRVILESASAEARAGELVRGSLRFTLTDYVGR